MKAIAFQHWHRPHHFSKHSQGFSLVELLVVMGIMAILAAVMLPAFNALTSANGLSQAAADIGGTMESARAYAMANNTYVYVGLQEVDPVVPNSSTPVGRIVVGVAASADGTRPDCTFTGTSSLAVSSPTQSSGIILISKPQGFNGVHLMTAASLQQGAMVNRPQASIDLGNSATVATTTFQVPLTGAAQNQFSKVVEIDPQGVARVQTSTTGFSSAVVDYLEIPMVAAHGDQVPAKTPANQAAVQVDGITGTVRIYRP